MKNYEIIQAIRKAANFAKSSDLLSEFGEFMCQYQNIPSTLTETMDEFAAWVGEPETFTRV